METITSTTLLQGLRDAGNTTAWRRFDERYRVMVVAYARKLGLSGSDAEDVGQETVVAFVRGYGDGGYDPCKGRLRSWLFSIAHHKAIDVLRRSARENVLSARADGTRLLQGIPSREEAEERWEAEWRRFALRACLAEVAQRVQRKTYAAFELYVLQGWTVDAVAEHLHMSENAVYIAKNRIISRVRQLWPEMETNW